MKCIFCLCEKEPSQEHIIPYALGGSLTTSKVCKDCNSWLGKAIDSNFCDNILMRLPRCIMGIKGQSGSRIRSIFDHATGELDCGVFFHGDRDGLPDIEQKIDVESTNNAVKVKAVFPAYADSRRIEGSIRQAVLKKLKDGDSKTADSNHLATANRIAIEAYAQAQRKESKEVIIHETINFDELTLEFLKIAYEMACEAFGEDYYMQSHTANILRGAIHLRNAKASIHGQVLLTDTCLNSLLEKASGGNKHVIILLKGCAIISIFGINAVVRYEETDERFITDMDSASIYFLNHLERKTYKSSLEDWLAHEIK